MGYILKINEHQAEVLCRALDLFSRTGMGQFNELLYTFELSHLHSYSDNNYLGIVDRVRSLLANIHILLTKLPPNASFGMTSGKINDIFRVAWDLQQVIAHCMSWKQSPGGGTGVNFSEPFRSSTKEPLAEVSYVEDGDKEEVNE